MIEENKNIISALFTNEKVEEIKLFADMAMQTKITEMQTNDPEFDATPDFQEAYLEEFVSGYQEGLLGNMLSEIKLMKPELADELIVACKSEDEICTLFEMSKKDLVTMINKE